MITGKVTQSRHLKEKERSQGDVFREEGPGREERQASTQGQETFRMKREADRSGSKVSEGEAGRRQEELMH